MIATDGMPARTPENSREEKAAAMRVVLTFARDVQDARLLLEMLGLVPEGVLR